MPSRSLTAITIFARDPSGRRICARVSLAVATALLMICITSADVNPPSGPMVSFSVARLKFQSKVNNALPRAQDGGLAFESWDEAFGGNAGILLKPIAKLRIGLDLSIAGGLQVRLSGRIFTNLGPLLNSYSQSNRRISRSISRWKVPQQVMLSGLYEVTPQLQPDG